MHMTASSQIRCISCSPLEVYDLQTLQAAAFADGLSFCLRFLERADIHRELTLRHFVSGDIGVITLSGAGLCRKAPSVDSLSVQTLNLQRERLVTAP
jgi:hypothetical protein